MFEDEFRRVHVHVFAFGLLRCCFTAYDDSVHGGFAMFCTNGSV